MNARPWPVRVNDTLVPTDGAALRANNFNAMRLTMALAVVWSHSFALFKGSEATEPVSLLMGGIVNAGNLGVLTFFAISGFLITRSYLQTPSNLAYLRKRIARIYPGFLVAILFCTFVVIPIFSSREMTDLSFLEIRRLVTRNLLLKHYFPPSDVFWNGHPGWTGNVNGSLWSISYEFWCYLGVLALGVAGMLRRSVWLALISFAAIAARAWLDSIGWEPIGPLHSIIGTVYRWLVVLPPFTLGALLLLYGKKMPRSRALLAGSIAATILAAHLPIDPLYRTILTRTMLPPVLAYTTIYVAFSRTLRLPDAARWGDISYGTYLYAFPIQQVLFVTFHDRIGFVGLVILSMILSLVAGALSWFAVERWFVMKRRRKAPPLTNEANLVAP